MLEVAVREGRFEEEGWRLRKDGTTFWANVVITALRDEQGVLVGFAKVTQNLLANALKFGGPQPHVELTAEPAGDGFWRIVVADDGIGIPADEQERIFDLFHRLHPREAYAGTGLGLALTRRLVDRHGGRIGVDSSPGRGSRFWFTLPSTEGR